MNKAAIIKRLKEIQAELRENKEGINVEALETEIRDLTQQLNDIERRESLIDEIEKRDLAVPDKVEEEKRKESAAEQRGKALKEGRAVKIDSGTLVVPTYSGTDINSTYQQVSSLVDLVVSQELPGGESYQEPYEKLTGDGGYTAEGTAYTEADTAMDYAEMKKTKITAYSEISEEATKLPNANYDEVASKGITTSLRKKIAKEIINGDGGSGHLVGIFSTQAKAIDADTDLSISAINGDTLDEIVYSYGGEESVEGGKAYLIMNKKDLRAFAKLKSTDGKKLHKITLDGSTGTIDDVPFVLNSACPALSEASTANGKYCMAYGYTTNYKLSFFADVDLQKSGDYKFREGMIANKGSVMVGGNVVAHNGFIRVKKVASV